MRFEIHTVIFFVSARMRHKVSVKLRCGQNEPTGEQLASRERGPAQLIVMVTFGRDGGAYEDVEAREIGEAQVSFDRCPQRPIGTSIPQGTAPSQDQPAPR